MAIPAKTEEAPIRKLVFLKKKELKKAGISRVFSLDWWFSRYHMHN